MALASSARIAKRYSFSAGHQLPDHSGKCARPHGHNYVLEVVCQGIIRSERGLSSDGMVLDYDDIDRFVKPLLDQLLDHRDLNETLVPWLDGAPTTAENIAATILALLGDVPGLAEVAVCETPKTEARVFARSVPFPDPPARQLEGSL